MSRSDNNSKTPAKKGGGYARQCVYCDDPDMRRLKKLLARRDETLSQWFRRKVRDELADAYA